MSVVTSSSNPKFDVEGNTVPVTAGPSQSRFGKKSIFAALGVVAIVGAAVAAVTLSSGGADEASGAAKVGAPCDELCQKPAVISEQMTLLMNMKLEQQQQRQADLAARGESFVKQAAAPCVNGNAGGYPCKDIDLLSFTPISDMGGSSGDEANDSWGWVDPQNGDEYALVGLQRGMGVVRVTDPLNPVPVAFVPGANSAWHDIKVCQDHAYIVSEGSQGMQVFDLTRVRGVTTRQTMNPDAVYRGSGNVVNTAHNIVINEETKYAYIVGARRTCGGGLHAVDISSPKEPVFAGCVGNDGYTHDAQCIVYRGVDQEFVGREICFAYNEDTVTIFDATDKQNVEQISRFSYNSARYVHQGWTNGPDASYILIDDELDEEQVGSISTTRTIVANIKSLRNPTIAKYYTNDQRAIDHNLYTLNGYAYCANYGSGLRIVDISGLDSGVMTEVAYFDVAPESSRVEFKGSWSSYIYFPSGNIVISSIERGLFMVKANLAPTPAPVPTPLPTDAPTPIPSAAPTDAPTNPTPPPVPSTNPTEPPTATPDEEWICNPSYEGASDGCDCGCGRVDPDCEGTYRYLYCDGPATTARSTTYYTCDITVSGGGRCVWKGWGKGEEPAEEDANPTKPKN